MPQNIDLKDLKRSFSESVARGQLGEARRLYDEHVAPSAAPTGAKLNMLGALSKAGVKGLEPQLAALTGEHGGRSQVRVAIFQARAGRPGEALARLEAIAAERPLSNQERILKVQLLARQGRLAKALDEAHRLCEDAPDRAHFADAYIRLLFATGRFEEGVRALDEALRRFPMSGQMLMRVHRLPLPRRPFERMYHQAQTNWRENELPPNAAFTFARLALKQGDFADARAALSQARRVPQAEVLLQALDNTPAEQWWAQGRLDNNSIVSVQTARHPEARATLLYFPSRYNDFAPFSLRCLDGLLSAYPVNVLYLRDRRFRSFMQGLPGHGETPEQAANCLRTQLAELGDLPILTLGVSLGGFAAVRYGALLGARKVLSFAGPTLLDGAPDDEEEDGEEAFDRGRLILSPEARDVLPDIEAHSDMDVTLVLSGEHRRDVDHAKRLEGLPNVRLRLIPGTDEHAGLVQKLTATGEFERILGEWLS